MMNKKLKIAISSCLLFAFLLCIGFVLAKEKPLWQDEIYTQRVTTQALSYQEMLFGKIGEGNAYPLFYMVQKAICQLVQYEFSQHWVSSSVNELRGQFLMRINPIVFMSLSIVLIFYYFFRNFSGWIACYSVLISLSSYMVWAFYAEARPYALWTFITTVHLLLFMHIVRKREMTVPLFIGLSINHILLSLTTLFGIVQILTVTTLLMFTVERKWIKYLILQVILPSALCLFYIMHTINLNFWIWDSPMGVIYANIPRDRLFIMGCSVGLIIFYFFKEKNRPRNTVEKSLISKSEWREGTFFLALTALMFMAALSVLALFMLKAVPFGEGFPVSNRYFIYLTPVGIMATTLFSVYLVKIFDGIKPVQIGVILGLAWLLIFRMLRTIPLISGYYQIKSISQLFSG